MQAATRQLAHHWVLEEPSDVPAGLVEDFLIPAAAAVPEAMARRLGLCRILLAPAIGTEASSRWSRPAGRMEIELALEDSGAHDVAMELLVCLGQALWERLEEQEWRAWWTLLDHEIRAGVAGEIDEDALEHKRRLIGAGGRDSTLLERFGFAAFAGTAAEYVHCLWHEVTVRQGPDHLPPQWLRRRLELLAGWFPPNPGNRLFP